MSGLYRWRRTYLNAKAPTNGENRSYDDLLKEIKALKKRLNLVTSVNSTLKKTAAILSQDHLGGLK
ncbi:MAG: hypothetical protein OXC44_03470 [Proteobacteria bacterium]|nr:hypothetical protein [Pseudomonadota bacterium]